MIKLKKYIFFVILLVAIGAIESLAFAFTSWQYPGQPTIYSRSDWGARAPQSSMASRGTAYWVIFHHSADSFSSTDFSTTAAEIRRIQNVHMDTNGWSDIGYHFIVDRVGRAWRGREWNNVGAHTSGYNDNYGVCILGNYEGAWGIGAQFATSAQINTMSSLAAYIAWCEGISLPVCNNHKNFTSTVCPGRNLAPVVIDDVEAGVQNLLKRP